MRGVMPPPGNGASTWKACVNLMKVMMSAGILAQPSVAHKLGLGYWFCAWSLSMGVSGRHQTTTRSGWP